MCGRNKHDWLNEAYRKTDNDIFVYTNKIIYKQDKQQS